VRDYYEVSSEGYSRLSLSSTLRRYISLPIAFDQSAQLVPGGGSYNMHSYQAYQLLSLTLNYTDSISGNCTDICTIK